MAKNNSAVEKLKKTLAEIKIEIQNTTAGTDREDGSVFAGVTSDGKWIYAMPVDLGFTANFNNAAKAVEKLNEKKALGHDDWQIPDLDTLKVLQRNQNRGSLKDTFNTSDKGSGLDLQGLYWSSTKDLNDSSHAYGLHFSDGTPDLIYKYGFRLSCRPVRLVAPAPSGKL